eukprot:5596861-Pleurochrysis_carterae.AAC.1
MAQQNVVLSIRRPASALQTHKKAYTFIEHVVKTQIKLVDTSRIDIVSCMLLILFTRSRPVTARANERTRVRLGRRATSKPFGP